MNDLKFAFRQLLRSPGFTAVAVLTLALGIGANLAVLSLINGMFLRPLPGIQNPSGLLTIGGADRAGGFGDVSFPNYLDLSDRNSVFSEVAAFAESPFNVSADNLTERLIGEMVSANYFRTLGVIMAAGRDFRPEEDEAAGRNPVAVISHRLWQHRWNGDQGAIGKEIVINNHPFTIIGVAAKDFRGYQLPTAHSVWVPLHMAPQIQASGDERFVGRQFTWLRRLVGRLRPGVSVAEAEANLAVLSRQLEDAYPAENKDRSFRAFEYSPFPAANKTAPRVFASVLAGMTLIVLLVVCANIASLFVSRAASRQRESAVRLALGSSRSRLVRQVLAEGSIIAAISAGLGLLIATEGAGLLLSQVPGEAGEPVAIDLAADWRVVGFAGALALLSTLGVGLLPALQATRVDLLPALKSGEGSHSSRRSRLRSTLVAVQVVFSVILLVVSGLMFRSLSLLREIDPGMRVNNLLLANIDPRLNGYDNERSRRFNGDLLDRLNARPGIEAASLAVMPPFGGRGMSRGNVHGGRLAPTEAFSCSLNFVTADYFRTTGITLLRGREFLPNEPRDSRAVIVNQTLAQKLWPNSDALGQPLHLASNTEEPMQVVGVVSDSIYGDLASEAKQPRPYYYRPLSSQISDLPICLHIRAAADPTGLLRSVRQVVAELDTHLPLFRVRTLKKLRDEAFWQQRLAAGLVTFSGVLAIVLATVGLYAALAQDVSRRTREIGIRLALGADRRDVLRLILRQGMKLTAIGAAFGLAASLGLTQVLRNLLYGVSPSDPLTFVAVCLLLCAVALLACWLPARRAAKVDPMEALRYE
jgi:predicted permease